MCRSHRGPAWRQAGVWALDTLEENLGQDWLGRTIEKYRRLELGEMLPYFIQLGPAHTLAYVDLLEFALRLEILSDVRGMGKVRKVLRGIPRPDQLSHVMVQLETASLALMRGCAMDIESGLAHSHRPADLVLQVAGSSVQVELAVLLPDRSFRQADKRTDRLFKLIHALEARYDVTCDGRLPEVLNDTDEQEFLVQLDRAARRVRDEASARRVEVAEASILVSSDRGVSTAGLSVAFPTVDSTWRLGSLLRKKAEQTLGYGCVWLRVDARDGLWQFTPWSQMDLSEKLFVLRPLLSEVLDDSAHVGGVVITSGSVHAQGAFEDESVEAGGGVGVRRLIQPLRVRETMIIPLHDGPAPWSGVWRELYEQEPAELQWCLARVGLPGVEEIFGTSHQGRDEEEQA